MPALEGHLNGLEIVNYIKKEIQFGFIRILLLIQLPFRECGRVVFL